jgi:hypothetical protein
VRWLFPGKQIRIDTFCLDCGKPIRVQMRDDELLEVNPDTSVGHMNIAFANVLKGETTWGKA